MSKPERTVLQVSMTRAQMDLMEFLLQMVHHDRYTKSSFVLEQIRNQVRNYLSLPDDIGFTDEQLLQMAIDKNESDIKSIIGEEQYNKFYEIKEGEQNE